MKIDESKLLNLEEEKIDCGPRTLEILGYNEVYFVISKRLEDFMKEKNYTKKDIAKLTKTSPKTVTKILRGTKKLELEFTYRFLRRLTKSPRIIIEIMEEVSKRISDM